MCDGGVLVTSERSSGRSRKVLIVIVIAALLSPLVLSPAIRRALTEHWPLKEPYLKYSKWRYNWRSPSDLGDGKLASQIIIEGPMGIAEDPEGNLFVSDREGRLIWKIENSGRAVVVAGTGKATGSNGLPSGRVPARDVDLAVPEGLVVDHDRNILFADSYNHLILKIDREGYLSRFAGNGQPGLGLEGIPATDSSLAFPSDVRLDSQGNVFVADLMNHRIRKITRDGLITTVAGTGVAGYNGDGGPAVDAQLNTPYGIFLDKNDNLLIADSNNNVIRKVGKDGIIQTIAGTGEKGYEGDGGQARQAKLDAPQSLGIDAEGRIYIGDEHNDAIRVLELDGTMRTIVGGKGPGFSGDGGLASQAQIADPENLLVRKDGSILITVRDNARLRIVSPDGIINTFAGRGPTSTHDYYAPISLPSVEP
jgi:sugar lactone lactonase YvrE